ncbi:MAG: ankyrin repeat domain-containing protein, partial [Burkholderiaceae bacterium]
GHLRTAALLIAMGADARRTTLHGATPLMLAVAGGHAELAEALLRAGADPNAQDQFGRTALHEAARRGDLAVARLLMRHGADATLASRYGMNALQVARRTGHDELLLALQASASVMPERGGHAVSSSAAFVLLPETATGVESVLSFPSH